ncbi:tripartite tricarboxylate transporter substrate binding protein [Roseomonas sp. KE0001]|uniref:Bug family tripartite tricarboxylate transporter substrate binding protein n=1 Tax=Roseomonas sp. KE0001 TaxID=2479201 RepID=UPI0018E004CF|nr:tripartite tricarboxylate transporter substrate binding protein [Roseomonas sp. KE0001]MBI0433235.1 tripartite tricarboxylate transporter substrate binding protein [Roseomonas sp. KE0001]
MTPTRRLLLGAAPAALLPLAMPRLARAQGNSITLLVPTAPGGSTDFAGRLLAEPLSRRLGQPVVVENRGGANGALATGAVARAQPDGATLLVQYAGYHVGTPAIIPDLGYDVVKDFTPLSLLMEAPQAVFTHPSVPAKDMAELVAHAKAHPGQLNYASAGNGSIQHLGTELLKQREGIEMTHVSYRGTGPAIQDLIAGRVQVFLTTPPPLMPFVREGKLRALAIAAETRHPALPEVPTMAEAGLPGFLSLAWFAVFAPARLPEDKARRLVGAIEAVTQEPDYQRRVTEQGGFVRRQSGAELGHRVEEELAEWRRVAREAGIKAE